MSYYKVKQVYPDFYTIFDPIGVFCYLIVGKNRALLFDTAHGISSLDDVVREITDLPYEVVLSHGHWDHTAGAFEFDKVWLHPGDKEICLRHFNENTRKSIINWYSKEIHENNPNFNENAYLKSDSKIPEIKDLVDNQIFDLGGVNVKIINMQGHTPGSIAILVKEHKLLIDGDAANRHCWMFLEDSLRMPVYIETLKRVSKLDFDSFYMSHNETLYPKSDFEKFIDVAQNIDIKRAKPYDYKFNILGGYFYCEDEFGIVFDPKRL